MHMTEPDESGNSTLLNNNININKHLVKNNN